jgi:ribosomal protein L22
MSTSEDKPKRPRRKKAPEAAEAEPETSSASEAPRDEDKTGAEEEATRGAPDADDAPAEEAGSGGEQPAKPRRSASKPATPAKPAPSRRRTKKEAPLGPPPVVRAQARYVRSSPRKARLVCDHIRGRTVEEARAILAHTPRAIARDWSKLLESAVANAEHNHELVGEDLFVKAVSADDGPTIRRFRPRAMGRATRIRKRTAHLTILLTPKQ